MGTLAFAFVVAWFVTTTYVAWLGRTQWLLARRLRELEAAMTTAAPEDSRLKPAKVA